MYNISVRVALAGPFVLLSQRIAGLLSGATVRASLRALPLSIFASDRNGLRSAAAAESPDVVTAHRPHPAVGTC